METSVWKINVVVSILEKAAANLGRVYVLGAEVCPESGGRFSEVGIICLESEARLCTGVEICPKSEARLSEVGIICLESGARLCTVGEICPKSEARFSEVGMISPRSGAYK